MLFSHSECQDPEGHSKCYQGNHSEASTVFPGHNVRLSCHSVHLGGNFKKKKRSYWNNYIISDFLASGQPPLPNNLQDCTLQVYATPQPGLTQLYSVHHEFTKIWCFNINISQSSDLWDIYLVNPSSILALKPHSNCLRLVLHASINPAKWHVKTCYYFDEFRTFGVMLKQRASWSL